MSIDRRRFLRQAAGMSGAAVLSQTTGWSQIAGSAKAQAAAGPAGSAKERAMRPAVLAQARTFSSGAALPTPDESGIKHIIVVPLENRSFDHLMGWLPNADGKQMNSYPLPNNGGLASTHPLAPDYRGCGHPGPDHSYAGGRIQYDGGKMDGWLLDTNNDKYSIGYYGAADMPFLAALAQNYTTLDNNFCSILGPTFPNRLFMLAGQTDRLDNSLNFTGLPTIFDTLFLAGVSARYFFSNFAFLELWGLKYLPFLRTYYSFLLKARSGTLPAVSFLDPQFTLLNFDRGNDAHPNSNIRRADNFLSNVFRAVTHGPAWASTVFIVTFDEWGGFFDHVAPPRAPAPNGVDPDLDSSGNALLGFRVPAIIASPWTRGDPANPTVISDVFDHTSILKLIEWRWGLPPLTSRDGAPDSVIGNLASVLNFGAPNAQVPVLPRPPRPPSIPCFPFNIEF